MLGPTTLLQVGHLDPLSSHLYVLWVLSCDHHGRRLLHGLYKALLFAVHTDTNLQKMVLTCTQVALSTWKVKYLSDMESELGLSSEDEAEGLPPHRAVARRLPAHHGGAPFQSPVPQPAAASSTVGM